LLEPLPAYKKPKNRRLPPGRPIGAKAPGGRMRKKNAVMRGVMITGLVMGVGLCILVCLLTGTYKKFEELSQPGGATPTPTPTPAPLGAVVAQTAWEDLIFPVILLLLCVAGALYVLFQSGEKPD